MLNAEEQRQIIKANNEAFEALARRWRYPESGETEPNLKVAIQRMVLYYFTPYGLRDLHRLICGLRNAAINSRGNEPSRANRNTEPDPEIIQQNAADFEQLALKWRDSLTGKIAETDLGIAVIYMILDYFDCDNSSDLYFCDLLAAVEEKLRLIDIKFHGLAGLPKKRDLGRN